MTRDRDQAAQNAKWGPSDGAGQTARSDQPADDVALAHRLADAAGAAIAPHFRSNGLDAENKAAQGFDPVTAADRAAERAIRALLAQEAPDDGVFGEEYERVDGSSGRQWVIDPIDGTRGFMTGLVHWGVLIALRTGDTVTLGLLDQPHIGERFIGVVGQGATLIGRSATRGLRTRACAGLAAATLLTTDPDLFAAGGERAAYDAVARQTKLRRYGADCYAYAMVAGGWADLVVEAGLSPYDIQALIPIVEEAGGRVTDWRGRTNPWEGRIIAAGDPRVHAEAVSILSQAD